MDKEFVRTITRPGITVLLIVVCLALVVMKALGYSDMEVPDWLQVLTAGSVGWWFSDRTRKNASEEKKGGNNQ